jgi:hypothetical protein
MPERLVINTGPIVALARAGLTATLAKMPFDFLTPLQVQREIQQDPAAGHAIIDISWVRTVSLATPLSALAVSNLDEGEAAVIQLALDESISLVCIDERKGRRAALGRGGRAVLRELVAHLEGLERDIGHPSVRKISSCAACASPPRRPPASRFGSRWTGQREESSSRRRSSPRLRTSASASARATPREGRSAHHESPRFRCCKATRSGV